MTHITLTISDFFLSVFCIRITSKKTKILYQGCVEIIVLKSFFKTLFHIKARLVYRTNRSEFLCYSADIYFCNYKSNGPLINNCFIIYFPFKSSLNAPFKWLSLNHTINRLFFKTTICSFWVKNYYYTQ